MTTRFAPGRTEVETAKLAYARRLDRLAGGRPLAVWGAGRAGALAVGLLRGLGRPPAFVLDRDPERHGSHLDGIPVVGVDVLDAVEPATGPFVMLASMHEPDMAAWLTVRGWVRGRDFTRCPIGSIYAPELGYVLELLPDPPHRRRRPAEASAAAGHEVTIFASRSGNFYFRELQAFLVDGLRRTGWHAHAADEHALGTTGAAIVVGPHEFFTVGAGPRWLTADNLRAAVLLTTEQPQSFWTQAFARAINLAGAVVDLSPAVARALTARDRPARWLPLGWFPGCAPFDVVPSGLRLPGIDGVVAAGRLPAAASDRWDDRPIDVLFVGSYSPRRAEWLTTLQTALPQCRWHVHLPNDVRPIGDGGHDSAVAVALARRAKIVLNLHRDDTEYFEWQRIVWRGLWQRALVVSEPTGGVPGLEAGRDYLEVPIEHMAAALRRLLTTAPGGVAADAIRQAGWAASVGVPFGLTAEVLGAALVEAGAVDVARPRVAS